MAKKIIDSLYDTETGMLSKYKRLQVGNSGWLTWIMFELVTMLFANLHGAAGLFLRSKLYRPFFKKIGRGVVFGAGVVIRNPGAIEIGDQVIVDDLSVLDAKSDSTETCIVIGDRVFISRNVILGCKSGRIQLGSGVSLGPNTIIHSIEQSHVTVGDHSVIASNAYLIGGPDYLMERRDIPMMKQGFKAFQGITVGDDVWLGAYVAVLDGSVINRGAVVGAMAMVRGELPAYSISHGVPAKVHSYRKGGDAG